MLYGLSVLEGLLLIGAAVGGLSVLLGLVLLFLFWWRPVVPNTPGNALKVKLPIGLDINLGTITAAPFVLGLIFLGGIVYAGYHFAPAAFPIRGTVKLTSTRTAPGIAIGVLPSNHLTQTQQDGTFRMVIPKQAARGITYQAVVYMPNSNPPAFHLGVVKFDADGEGTFEHILTGGR